TPASQLYTEESISNEELTADQLIDKAQTNASLLAEIIAASTDEILNLRDFENSEVIQTLHRECQGISDYLFERIWYDSGNDADAQYYAYDSSSRHETYQKTPEEEAQIAAFIACSEQIQAAFRRYDELKDHLQAKQLQQEENTRANVDTLDDDIDASDNDDDDDDAYNASLLGTSHGGGSIAHNANHHLRRSEQPLEWKLDPREDFKANKMKMKKRMDQAERERIEQERWQERKEALNIKTPGAVEIPAEVLVIDHPVQPVEEREQEEQEYRRLKEEEISKALEPEDGAEDADALAPAESNTIASTFASTSNASHKADHLMDEDEDEEDDFDEATAMDTEADSALEAMMREVAAAKHARDIAKLMDSDDMNGILKDIAHFQALSASKGSDVSGMVEDDPEYQLIVKANTITVAIDNEMLVVHKFIRDHYEPKFPELETVVANPMDYARTVKRIANQDDITKVDLHDILPSATVMVVVVTGTTTEGRTLTESEWRACDEACDLAFELERAKATIIEYVESRLTFIAPNLSAIIGTATAAKLMGQAGGLTSLSKMPACNIQVLGQDKSLNSALSAASNVRNVGYAYYSPFILSYPVEVRKKALKMTAAKLALAARIDRVHSYPDGSWGRKIKDEIERKVEKLLEAPPQKNVKALPAPLEAPKKRRGGRRARKEKELYAVSEMQKLKNRVAFGQEEQEVMGYGTSEGMGMLGQNYSGPGAGRIRGPQTKERNRGKISNRNAARLAQYGSGGGTGTAGTASSIAFTPVQGIELVDPTAAAAKLKALNERYFGSQGFMKMKKEES
ncbi:U4/U6 small nuclear ribonucleoprotein Prp31, partial [Haplosporangium bisporale]